MTKRKTKINDKYIRLAGLLFVLLLCTGCGRKKPVEEPTPTQEPFPSQTTEAPVVTSDPIESLPPFSEEPSLPAEETPAPVFYLPEPEQHLFDWEGEPYLWLDLNLIASGLTADHSVQGMAMGTIDGSPLLFMSLSDGVAADSGILVLYDLLNMEIITSVKNVDIGHGNGVAFCSADRLFYVACGGGSNGLHVVKAYDTSLNCIRTIDMDDLSVGSPYGIVYDSEKNCFLASTAGDLLTEFDYDFNVQRSSELMIPDGGYVSQSLFLQNGLVNQIFVAPGKVHSLLYKYDWNKDSISFDSAEYISQSGELEAGAIYGGQRYLAFTISGGVLLRVEELE